MTEIEPDLTSFSRKEHETWDSRSNPALPYVVKLRWLQRVVPLPGTLPHYTPVVSTDIFNNIRRIVNAAQLQGGGDTQLQLISLCPPGANGVSPK